MLDLSLISPTEIIHEPIRLHGNNYFSNDYPYAFYRKQKNGEQPL